MLLVAITRCTSRSLSWLWGRSVFAEGQELQSRLTSLGPSLIYLVHCWSTLGSSKGKVVRGDRIHQKASGFRWPEEDPGCSSPVVSASVCRSPRYYRSKLRDKVVSNWHCLVVLRAPWVIGVENLPLLLICSESSSNTFDFLYYCTFRKFSQSVSLLHSTIIIVKKGSHPGTFGGRSGTV